MRAGGSEAVIDSTVETITGPRSPGKREVSQQRLYTCRALLRCLRDHRVPLLIHPQMAQTFRDSTALSNICLKVNVPVLCSVAPTFKGGTPSLDQLLASREGSGRLTSIYVDIGTYHDNASNSEQTLCFYLPLRRMSVRKKRSLHEKKQLYAFPIPMMGPSHYSEDGNVSTLPLLETRASARDGLFSLMRRRNPDRFLMSSSGLKQ